MFKRESRRDIKQRRRGLHPLRVALPLAGHGAWVDLALRNGDVLRVGWRRENPGVQLAWGGGMVVDSHCGLSLLLVGEDSQAGQCRGIKA